ncbi:MAG TPA: hypothetical protein VF581_06805 [Flavobacterium sp.]|jgi:hypothetical protein
MNSSSDFKQLWKNRQADAPDIQKLLQLAHKFRNDHLRKLLVANLALVATTGFMIWVWYFYQPEMVTTKIGLVTVMLAMAMYLLAYNRMLPLLIRVKSDSSSKTYLQELRKVKERQRLLQTSVLNVYFILLGSGLCLYLYEYTSRMLIEYAVLTYGLTLSWIALNWFYFRPKTIRKQQKATNEIIANLEKVQQQFTEADNMI